MAVFDEDGELVLRAAYRSARDVEVGDGRFHRLLVEGRGAGSFAQLQAGEFEEGVVLLVADQGEDEVGGDVERALTPTLSRSTGRGRNALERDVRGRDLAGHGREMRA